MNISPLSQDRIAVVSALASEQANRAEPFAERRSRGVSAPAIFKKSKKKIAASDTKLATTWCW